MPARSVNSQLTAGVGRLSRRSEAADGAEPDGLCKMLRPAASAEAGRFSINPR
jgi:hypothetical protein